jgi:hypothetical protein
MVTRVASTGLFVADLAHFHLFDVHLRIFRFTFTRSRRFVRVFRERPFTPSPSPPPNSLSPPSLSLCAPSSKLILHHHHHHHHHPPHPPLLLLLFPSTFTRVIICITVLSSAASPLTSDLSTSSQSPSYSHALLVRPCPPRSELRPSQHVIHCRSIGTSAFTDPSAVPTINRTRRFDSSHSSSSLQSPNQ